MASTITFCDAIEAKNSHIDFLVNDTTLTDTMRGKEVNAVFADAETLLAGYEVAENWKDPGPWLRRLGTDSLANEARAATRALDLLAKFKLGLLLVPRKLVDSETVVDDLLASADSCKQMLMAIKREAKDIADDRAAELLNATASLDRAEPETDNESVAWAKVITVKPAKDKKNKKVRSVRPIPLTAAKLGPEDMAFIGANDENSAGELPDEWRFPTRTARLSILKVPGQNAPYLGDKRVKLASLNAEQRKKVVFKPFAPAQYFRYEDCDVALLNNFRDEGYIPTEAVAKAVSLGLFSSNDEAVPLGIDEDLIVGKASQEAIDNADLILAWGQIEAILRRNELEGKIPFVAKWAMRLMTLPVEFSSQAPRVLEKLLAFLRFNVHETAAVNKTLRGFITAMLSSWKAGESRADYIKRSAKSVNVYWGPYAKNWTAYWCSMPWNTDSVKPGKNTILSRMLTKVRTKSKNVVDQTFAAAAAGKELAAETIEVVGNDLEEIDKAFNTASIAARAQAKARVIGGRFWQLFKTEQSEAAQYSAAYNNVEALTVRQKIAHLLKLTIGRPFYRPKLKVEINDSGEVRERIEVVNRDWYISMLDGFSHFGKPPGAEGQDEYGSKMPMVIKFPFYLASGLASVVHTGFAKASNLFGTYQGMETETVDSATPPRAAFKRLAKGIAGTLLLVGGMPFAATAAGYSLAVSASTWLGGLIFGEAVVRKVAATPSASELAEVEEAAIAKRAANAPQGEISIADLRQDVGAVGATTDGNTAVPNPFDD